MKTTPEMTAVAMNAAAGVALPGRRGIDGVHVDGVHVDEAEVADLTVEELLDRSGAIDQAEAVLLALHAAVLDEMVRRWGRTRALRRWRNCL